MVVLSAVSRMGGKLSIIFCQRTSDGKREVRKEGKLRGVLGACAHTCEKLTDSFMSLVSRGAVFSLTRSTRSVSMVMTRRLPGHLNFEVAADCGAAAVRTFSTGASAPSQS